MFYRRIFTLKSQAVCAISLSDQSSVPTKWNLQNSVNFDAALIYSYGIRQISVCNMWIFDSVSTLS